MNIIKLDYYDNKMFANIIGDWHSFMSPTKDILKTKKWRWDPAKKIWFKEIIEYEQEKLKLELKKEYSFFVEKFKKYLDVSKFKLAIVNINKLIESEKENKDKLPEGFNNIPEKLRKLLMPHQITGIKRFNKQDNQALFGWTMGTGKTLGALATAVCNKKKSLIILPKPLINQWKAEILKWNITSEDKIYLITGKKGNDLNDKYQYYLINYEKIRFLHKEKEKFNKKELNTYKWLINLIHQDFILIYDEAYKIKNYKSQLYKSHHELKHNFKWHGCIVLTGTPMEQNLFQFYTLINFVKRGIITWKDMESKFIYRPTAWESKFRNLKLFNIMASKIMQRVTKEDVKDNLPKMSIKHLFINNNKNAHELKENLKETAESFFEIYSTLRVIDSYLKPHENLKLYNVIKDYCIENIGKFDELKSIIEEIGNRQILIFTSYSRTMNWLVSKLKEEKYKVVGIDSGVKEKEKIKEKFVSGEIQIVIATDVWARGIDLPTIDYLVNWDMTPSISVYQQRINRICRINSERPKLIINLISDVIEKDIYEIIKNKILLTEQVVEGVEEKNIMKVLSNKWGIPLTRNIKDEN